MKSSFAKKLVTCLLASCLALAPAGHTVVGTAAVRKADVQTASAGNVLLGVEGTYENLAKETILERINAIRKEACSEGYINPSTGKKLKSSDYVAIKWSSDLEWIAQLRAAEATVNEGHTRPNGKDCFSLQYNGEQSWAENLAWNYSGIMDGIEQWYDEKGDWAKQNANAVTGHYTSLIDPNHTYVGIGAFRRSSGGWCGVAAEFSFQDRMDEAKSSLSGKSVQMMEVAQKNVGSSKIEAPATIKAGKTKKLRVVKEISYNGIMGGSNVTTGIVRGSITWKSSNNAVLTINAQGKATAKKAGKATVTATISGEKAMKVVIKVKK